MRRFIELKSVRLHLAKLDLLHRFILFLFLAAVVFMSVISARYFYLSRAAKTAGRAAPQAEGPTIDRVEIRNETKAIEVVSKKVEKEFLQVEIRNAGGRPVISYRIDFREGDMFVADSSVGSPLAPSRTTHVVVPVKKLAFDEQSQKYLITVSMALFDDGTGEGDRAKIEAQRDRMLGQAQAMSNMSELVNKLQSERELTSDQFGQQLKALKTLMPAHFNRDQTVGYMNAIQSMQARALVLNKLPDNKKAGGIENFKNAFVRQLSNLKMIKQEAK